MVSEVGQDQNIAGKEFLKKNNGVIRKYKWEQFSVRRSCEGNMAEKESYNKPGPLVLDAQVAENQRKFITRFEIYLVAAEKEKKADKIKVNLLLNCAGSDAIEEYTHFTYDADESPNNFADVCKKF